MTSSCIPVHSTVTSNLRLARLHRVAEPDCIMTRARFLTLADMYLSVGGCLLELTIERINYDD